METTTKNMRTTKITMTLAALVLLGLILGFSSHANAQVTCFPTCENDDRFLVLSGTGLQTLAGDSIEISLAVRGTIGGSLGQFTLSIFDGDTGGNWDRVDSVYGPVQMIYTLYADPLNDGIGNQVVWQETGANMINNGWYDVTLSNVSAAQAPSGSYFYRLVVTNPSPSVYALNTFKVKTTGVLTLQPKAFAVQAGLGIAADLPIVYPKYADGNLTSTIYDGNFDMHLYVPSTTSSLSMWDGDMDYGNFDKTTADTDDPDTPNNVLPPWALGTDAALEGVAVGTNGTTGDPSDDNSWAPARRSPSVTYQVTGPDGRNWINKNPSGNQEWEQFKIAVDAPRSEADYSETVPLSNGLYHVQMSGYDIFNLSAWRFFNDVIGVCPKVGTAAADPCQTPPKPYLVGDTVWRDIVTDGVQGTGEPGIANVKVYLLDSSGNYVLDINNQKIFALTDSNGYYQFEVEGYRVDTETGEVINDGVYTVLVGPENFNSGGALVNIPINTTGVRVTSGPYANGVILTRHIVGQTDVNMTYDFGFRTVGGGNDPYSIGDRVWWDVNGNGIQDSGEPGIGGVTLTLAIDYYGDGSDVVIKQTTTLSDGSYLFGFPYNIPGVTKLTVQVDSSNLTSGVLVGYVPSPSYQTVATDDSNKTPYTVSLAQNVYHDLTIDFGYISPSGGSQGCSPGYWKQTQHFDSWSYYLPGDSFNSVFGVPGYYTPDKTLLNALQTGGGGKNALGRAAVSALLNATNLDVNAKYSAAQVIKTVQDAFASGKYDDAKNKLESEWSPREHCPLN